MADRKYEGLIVTKARDADERVPRGPSTRVLWLDREVVPGAFFVGCAWYWPGQWIPEPTRGAHTHTFDEVIAFVGTNPSDPQDLGGEIELWLEDEPYVLTKSCLVFVPKGLKHCPLIVRRVDRPIFHFIAGVEERYS